MDYAKSGDPGLGVVIERRDSASNLAKMRMLSRYTQTTLSMRRSQKMSFIVVWKVAGLLVSPKNMTSSLESF